MLAIDKTFIFKGAEELIEPIYKIHQIFLHQNFIAYSI